MPASRVPAAQLTAGAQLLVDGIAWAVTSVREAFVTTGGTPHVRVRATRATGGLEYDLEVAVPYHHHPMEVWNPCP